ncbi:MAG TPA: response regulator transcription factor [Myxococcaceae bacterium]|nr:response regulator transcription factor [Myxococcaceae bacterium]
MTTENGGSVRVSLLDGQLLRGDALARVLSDAGYVVVGRHSQVDAFLSSLAQEQPHIACIDVSMDHDEGVNALAEARQFHPNLQVLAIGEGAGALDRCIAAGAAAYLDARNSLCNEGIHTLELLVRGERAISAHMLSTVFQATRAPEHEQLRPLSARERQVLSWVSAGADNGDIALSLQITERTVKAHVSSLYRKLRQDNRTQLALLARQLGIRPPSQ